MWLNPQGAWPLHPQDSSAPPRHTSTMEERGASMRAGARDIGARAVAFAETNVQASLNYAQSLVHAKDLSEVMRLHGDYVQAQMKTLADQAGEISQIVSRAAMDATKARH